MQLQLVVQVCLKTRKTSMELLWFIPIALAFFVGYRLQVIESKIKEAKTILEKKKDKPEVTSNESSVIDPFDPLQQAKWEHLAMMKKLNGDDYDEE